MLLAALAPVVGAGILSIGLAVGLGGRDTAAEMIRGRFGGQRRQWWLQGAPVERTPVPPQPPSTDNPEVAGRPDGPARR